MPGAGKYQPDPLPQLVLTYTPDRWPGAEEKLQPHTARWGGTSGQARGRIMKSISYWAAAMALNHNNTSFGRDVLECCWLRQ